MNSVTTAADQFARQASPWVQRLARFGYLAKGIVYLLVGGLAARAALGDGQATGSRGALRTLADEPLGTAALAVIAIGLFGYALWRGYTAIADPEHDGVAHRVYAGIVALLYTSIGVAAAQLALSGRGGGDGGTQRWTATALAQPLGRWLVAAAALAIIGVGIAQLVRAWQAKLDDELDLHRLRPRARAWVTRISRFGIAARAVVFVLVGFFLGKAALTYDASQARDPGGVLSSLQQGGETWLLALVAFGLCAYAVYQAVLARYRRIRVGNERAAIRVERA